MDFYINYIQDIDINNYLGIKISHSIIEPHLEKLKRLIGPEDYKIYTENQKEKYKGNYYLTAIDIPEMNHLISEMGIDDFVNSLEDRVFHYEIDDIRFLGVGRAQKNENVAFFIVCSSEKVNAVRKYYELDEKDLHITLGFNYNNVYGVGKNEVLKKDNKFLQLLKQLWEENDDWDFIKNIENFNLDPNCEIIPVQIKNNILTVKCDGYYLGVGYLEEGERWRILVKYPIDKDMPRMSENEISGILNKK